MPDSANMDTALRMMKSRLNRLPGDTSLNEYLEARIESAKGELQSKGINLEDTPEDMMLLVDKAVFDYGNRDKQAGEPDWLRMKIRERWLHERDS